MICRVCGSPMILDALVAHDARRALDPGQPAPVVMRCRHGHTARVSPVQLSPSAEAAAQRVVPQCAVCGVEIPRVHGVQARKSCSSEHRRFIERHRAEAQAAHNRLHRVHRADAPFVPFRFIIEAQPWYRGTATAFQPPARRDELVVPTGPDFPEIPAVWLEGFRRLYPTLEGAAAALAIFPPLEATDEATARWFNPRHYRRRIRSAPTPEQLMPYPVPQA